MCYNKVYTKERENNLMYTISVTPISTSHNAGERAEQNLIYTLCGEIRKHDSTPFDKSSDYPEMKLSIKSARFTLVSGRLMQAQTMHGQIEEYFNRTASTLWAYVSNDNIAYMMDKVEFYEFITTFAKFEKDSAKNGGYNKVRFPSETQAIKQWLAIRAH